MSKVAAAFAKCRRNGRAAFIPYFMAGFPGEEPFLRLVSSSFEAGADMVEIGIPFSDPVADGPAIQRAGQKVLENGMTTARVFELLDSLKLRADQPLLMMSYLNPILQFGLERFLARSVASGVRGLIVPDLVCEESAMIQPACRAAGIDLVFLVAPTSTSARRQKILKQSRGFVYAVSVLGVTGARTELPETMYGTIAQLKATTRTPIAIGFGISSVETAARAAGAADGIIVGSALIDEMKPDLTPDEQVDRVIAALRRFRDATYVKPVHERIERPSV